MVGNWSGKYDDGVAPYAWTGSTAILEEFLKKRKGVKFGHCWTFAAIATTGLFDDTPEQYFDSAEDYSELVDTLFTNGI